MGKVYKDINIKLSELDNYTVNRGDKNKVLYILDANYIPSLKLEFATDLNTLKT